MSVTERISTEIRRRLAAVLEHHFSPPRDTVDPEDVQVVVHATGSDENASGIEVWLEVSGSGLGLDFEGYGAFEDLLKRLDG